MKKIIDVTIGIVLLGTLFLSCSTNELDPDNSTEEEKSTIIEEQSSRVGGLRSGEIGESCLENDNGCDPGTYTWNFSLPQYPGCIFTIRADYLLCGGQGFSFSINLSDYEILWHNCTQFDQDVIDAIANGSIESFSIDFNQTVWNVVTEHLLSDSPPGLGTSLEITYHMASCIKYCYYKVSGHGDAVYINFEKNKCGENCCRILTQYIYNYTTETWEFSGTTNITANAPCISNFPTHCHSNSIGSTDCVDHCDIIL